MPINTKYQAIFTHDRYYHVFNRSVNGTNLFANKGNYTFFLQKFSKYLSNVLDVYAWVLLPNHFHFLVSVKKDSDCILTKQEKEAIDDQKKTINDVVIRRFKNFFISYSHSYKKQQQIKTNIFAQHFRRSEIDSDYYFSKVIYYIHLNPLHHKVTTAWEDYTWSSYGRIIQNVQSKLKVKEVLEWFGGIDRFIKYHNMQQDGYLFDED